MTNPKVSIIITTRNNSLTLEPLLQSIKEQTYPNTETVVVDNNSRDDTKDISKKYTRKVYNKGPERSAQRNFGVSKSNGKYVVILDSDMVLTKNVIRDCVLVIEKNNILGALVIPEKSIGDNFWAKCKAFEREFYLGDESIEAARFFKKTLFIKFKGYDTNLTGPEDFDLPLRMKKARIKIGRGKSFILHNEGKLSPFYSAKKKFYYASNARLYLSKHPDMILTQGNLLFRPVFFKKWKKLISQPLLTFGMILLRFLEMSAAALGITKALLKNK